MSMFGFALCFVLAASTPISIDAAELTRRAERTTRQIVDGGARWSVRQKLGKRADLALDVTQFGNEQQLDFVIVAGDKLSPLFSITARERVWIIKYPGAKPLLTRPWEAFLPVMSAYLLLAKSSLSAFHNDGNAVLVRETASSSTWASPRDPQVETSLRELVSGARGLIADAGDARVAELEKKLQTVPLVEVDNATGLVLHAGSDPQRGLFFSRVELLSSPPEIFKEKAPEPPGALDAEFMENALVFGWEPQWKPGDPEGEPDSVLVNFDRPERRRLPNQFGLSFQGAFLSPRTQLVVTTSMPSGGFRPLLIDVITGENRLLGDAWGAVPVVMFPVASPDGKKVAVLSQSNGAPLLRQLQVIDVASGAVKNVGAPADQLFVNWLPEGGFLLVRRLSRPGEKEPVSRIVRLSADGSKETELISNATRPLLVARGKRVLFKDLASGKWHTADLKGKQIKLLGDGLPGFYQPTADPLGESVLMLTNTPSVEPRFVIVETGEVLSHTLGSGRWSDPQWR